MPIENLGGSRIQITCKGGRGNGIVIRVLGGEAWLSLVVIAAGGQFLLLVRDVTREARLEQMRKDFVANASHELRSPLTVIAGYLDELGEENGLAAEWRDPLTDMRRQSARMREIVDDFSSLRSGIDATKRRRFGGYARSGPTGARAQPRNTAAHIDLSGTGARGHGSESDCIRSR